MPQFLPTVKTVGFLAEINMKLFIEKSKCRISESLNGFFIEVETDDPIDFIGGNGNNYILFDEDEEGIGPSPLSPFILEDKQE